MVHGFGAILAQFKKSRQRYGTIEEKRPSKPLQF
jgi:hypothetical protein